MPLMPLAERTIRVYCTAPLGADLSTFTTRAVVSFSTADQRDLAERLTEPPLGVIHRVISTTWFEPGSNMLRAEYLPIGGWKWLTDEDEAVFQLEWCMERSPSEGRHRWSTPNMQNLPRPKPGDR